MNVKALIFSLFFSLCFFAGRTFAAEEVRDPKKEKEDLAQLQSQYEGYLLRCMQMTLQHGASSLVESGFEATKNVTDLFHMAFRGPYAWLTSTQIQGLLSDHVKKTAGVKLSDTLESGKGGYKAQIRAILEAMIDRVNAQVLDSASTEGIKKINEEEKLKTFDALFESDDSTVTLPAQGICNLFETFYTEIEMVKKEIESPVVYISLLKKLFLDRLTSSKKMVILKEFNEQLEQILGSAPDGGFGDVRTIDAVLADLEKLFSQEKYDQFDAKKDEIIEEIDEIRESFNALDNHKKTYQGATENAKKDLVQDLLERYQEKKRIAPVSSQVQKKMDDIMGMLEAEIKRLDGHANLTEPGLAPERFAECEWYLDEIKQCKEWKDPWYASAPIVVPLTLITVLSGYLIYKGYRSHQDKKLNELKDKILFLNHIPKKERDLLLAHVNTDFCIQYVPVELLSALDAVIAFLEIEQKPLMHFYKKIDSLYEECLDKKDAQLYAAR